jgi:hypothetical protein
VESSGVAVRSGVRSGVAPRLHFGNFSQLPVDQRGLWTKALAKAQTRFYGFEVGIVHTALFRYRGHPPRFPVRHFLSDSLTVRLTTVRLAGSVTA